MTYHDGTILEGALDPTVSTPRIIGPATQTFSDGVKISGVMMLREDNFWGFDGPATVQYPNGTHITGAFILQSRGWHFVT